MKAANKDPSYAQRLMRGMIRATVVCFVLALVPYTQDPATPIKYLLLAWAVLLLGVTWFVGGVFTGLRVSRPSTLFWILVAFVSINATAALSSSFPLNSLNELRRIVLFGLLFLFAAQGVRTCGHAWTLMRTVCVALTLSSLYGFAQKAGIDPFPWAFRDVEEYLCVPATFGNPNLAAHALLLGIVMSFGLALRRESTRLGRIGAAVMTGIMLAHLLMTHSRAALAALAGGATFIILAMLIRRLGMRPIRGIVLTCVSVVLLGGASLGLVAVFLHAQTGSPLPLDTSVLLRYNSDYGAARMVLDRPFLGYGPGNYVIENVPFWTSYEQEWFAVERKVNEHVHNDLLETAVDAGLPGLLLYICLLIGAIVYALLEASTTRDGARRGLAYTLTTCFFVFAIDGLFGFNARVPVSGALFFLLLGILEGTGMAAQPAFQVDWPRWKSLALQCSAAAIAIAVSVTETQVFAARLLTQQACRVQQGNPDAAVACLQRAQSLAPWDWTIPHTLSLAERTNGCPSAAVEHAERALVLNPHYIMSYVCLANAYLDLAQAAYGPSDAPSLWACLDHAQTEANAALALSPRLPEAHISLGRVWSLRALHAAEIPNAEPASSAWREAIAYYRSALSATDDPSGRSRVQRMLAVAFIETGETKRAERSLRASIESDPSQRENWSLFLDHARKTRQYEDLSRSLHHALEHLKGRQPQDGDAIADLCLLLRTVHAEAGHDAEQVQAALESALDAAPTRLDVWAAWFSTLEPTLRRYALAQRITETRLRLEAQGHDLLPILAALDAVLQEDPRVTEQIERSVQDCDRRAAETSAEQVAIEYGWAVRFLSDELGKLKPVEPEKLRLTWSLGLLFLRCQMWSETENALAGIQQHIAPALVPDCLLARSEALSRLEKTSEALDFAREALRIAPERFDVRWNAAKRLAAAGHVAEARLEYKSLLAMPLTDERIRAALQEELHALSPSAPEGGAS